MLKHHGELSGARPVLRPDQLALEEHGPRGRLRQAEAYPPKRALARPGFADEADCLSFRDRQGDLIDGARDAPAPNGAGNVRYGDMPDIDDRVFHDARAGNNSLR